MFMTQMTFLAQVMKDPVLLVDWTHLGFSGSLWFYLHLWGIFWILFGKPPQLVMRKKEPCPQMLQSLQSLAFPHSEASAQSSTLASFCYFADFLTPFIFFLAGDAIGRLSPPVLFFHPSGSLGFRYPWQGAMEGQWAQSYTLPECPSLPVHMCVSSVHGLCRPLAALVSFQEGCDMN